MRGISLYQKIIFVMVFAAALAVCANYKTYIANLTGDNAQSIPDEGPGKIGILTDSTYYGDVKKNYPNADISYFSDTADMITALKSGKIDAFPEDAPKVGMIMQQEDALTCTETKFDSFDLAYVFARSPKGAVLCGKFNEFIKEKRESGELKRLEEKWSGTDESKKVPPPISEQTGSGEILDMATELELPPFAYKKDGKPAGYDIELAYMFCKENGYSLAVKDMAFDAIIPSIQSDKCDFGGAGITVTSERNETIYFSDPIYSTKAMLVTLKAKNYDMGLIEGIKDRFYKTFIREDRYKLFLTGICVTLTITVLSLVFGTLLGFCVYYLCKNGNIFANMLAGLFNWLIQGIPTVVLLMVLYYIVFGNVAVNGILVAVLCFTVTFAASMYSMLCMGADAVSSGQKKAAYALGFSEKQTFFKIILPQAVQNFMPTYKAELVAHIKNTAVVGYVAVQDLTKIGDIIRGRTYDAFFPLIAVTVIYFLIIAILTFFINRIDIKMNTFLRSKEQILKGIDTHDNT